jgi:hypothetical protein
MTASSLQLLTVYGTVNNPSGSHHEEKLPLIALLILVDQKLLSRSKPCTASSASVSRSVVNIITNLPFGETQTRFHCRDLPNCQCQLRQMQRAALSLQEEEWNEIQFSQMLRRAHLGGLCRYSRSSAREPAR